MAIVAIRRQAEIGPLPERRIGVVQRGADGERIAAAPVVDRAHVDAAEAELVVLHGRRWSAGLPLSCEREALSW